MKVFQKNQILTFFLFSYFLASCSFHVGADHPKSLMEKTFFYKDIGNFGGPFIKSPIMSNQTVVQPFESKCSNLNRIILPFFIEEKNGSGILTFNFYQNSKEKKLFFSTAINIKDFPPPKKIGTYDVDGVLHYIWIPPQPDSRDMSYSWELKSDEIDRQAIIGLYMNQSLNSQLQPVIIDGLVQDNTYVAFYSYCQYRFEWNKIFETTWDRFRREKVFLIFYLLLISGIIVSIKLAGKGNAGV